MAKRKPKDLGLLEKEMTTFSEDNKVKKVKKVILDEEDEKQAFINKIVCDGKVSFGKASWGTGKGPYLLAFEHSCDAMYCEMNAHEFKSVPLGEAKKHKFIPIWTTGAKKPEEINTLPRLNMEEFLKKTSKEKEEKKAARAAKMVKTRKKKAEL